MSVKKVVKVMNFHSLLRVDKSRKKASKYFSIENELFKVINHLIYNKNIILDKESILPDKDSPILNIYIGNDLGFCGDFNSQINSTLKTDNNYKILIGKKIHYDFNDDKVLLFQTKEEFFENFKPLQNIIYESILKRKYSEINIIYNHFYNINNLKFTKKKIFPIDRDFIKDENEDYNEDYALEVDLHTMMSDLISLFICYEIKICELNSYAAENVIRQQITRESLKKIDEIDDEKKKEELKIKKQKNFQKIIENFRKGD